MSGRLGTFLFGCTEFLRRTVFGARLIACVGDPATHPGVIVSSGQSVDTVYAAGDPVAVDGAMFACSVPGHGTAAITPTSKRTYYGGKLVVIEGSVAGCGARIRPPNRRVYAG